MHPSNFIYLEDVPIEQFLLPRRPPHPISYVNSRLRCSRRCTKREITSLLLPPPFPLEKYHHGCHALFFMARGFACCCCCCKVANYLSRHVGTPRSCSWMWCTALLAPLGHLSATLGFPFRALFCQIVHKYGPQFIFI